MLKKELKIISNYIIDNFNQQGKSILDDYNYNSLDDLVLVLDNKYPKEELLAQLTDRNVYDRLLSTLKETIEIKKSFGPAKITVYRELCYDYIEQTVYGEQVNGGNRYLLLQKIKEFEVLNEKEKGDKYEKLCTLFLNDLGLKAITTKSSNDGGIDIFGILNLSIENSFINFLGNSTIHFIGQVKFYNDKVDTPVIKHLIGDSVFYRFDPETVDILGTKTRLNNHPVYLCVFSHYGFTKQAQEYSSKHGIIMVDSGKLVDIICSMGKWNELQSVNYLLSG